MPLGDRAAPSGLRADRACVNTTRQALDICDRLDPGLSGMLGVALDVYHIWWDPEPMAQIARAGERSPAGVPCLGGLAGADQDILNDRGMMSDRAIDIPPARPRSRRRAAPAIPRSRSSPTTGGRSRWSRCAGRTHMAVIQDLREFSPTQGSSRGL